MVLGSEIDLLVDAGLIIHPVVLVLVSALILFILFLLGGGVGWIRTKLFKC